MEQQGGHSAEISQEAGERPKHALPRMLQAAELSDGLPFHAEEEELAPSQP